MANSTLKCVTGLNPITFANGTDLNTITNEGSYVCASASSAATLVNSPVSNASFEMLVLRKSTAYHSCGQLIITHDTLYYRDSTSAGFTSWKCLKGTETPTTATIYGSLYIQGDTIDDYIKNAADALASTVGEGSFTFDITWASHDAYLWTGVCRSSGMVRAYASTGNTAYSVNRGTGGTVTSYNLYGGTTPNMYTYYQGNETSSDATVTFARVRNTQNRYAGMLFVSSNNVNNTGVYAIGWKYGMTGASVSKLVGTSSRMPTINENGDISITLSGYSYAYLLATPQF